MYVGRDGAPAVMDHDADALMRQNKKKIDFIPLNC